MTPRVTRPTAASVLFVDHSSKIAGAELVLIDLVRLAPPGSAALLFEEGPLRRALEEEGIATLVARAAGDLSVIRRDRGLLRGLLKSRRLIALTREIAREARSRDVIYANSQKAFVLSAGAALLARRKLIWHLHDILDSSHFAAAQRRLVTWIANRTASCVIVPSRAAATAFVLAGGREDRVRIVPNGLDVMPPLKTRDEVRRSLGLPGGFLFGVFSRLAPWKGQHVALEALALLPDASLIIVGDAQFGEREYAESLRRLAGSLGVAHRVRFLGHRQDVPALMHAVDVVVHPSVDPEPFGRTLIEAMLLRRPVIASSGGAAAEILDGGRCGRLVAPRNAADIADALTEIRAGGRAVESRVALAASRARTLYHAARMRADVARLIKAVTRAVAG